MFSQRANFRAFGPSARRASMMMRGELNKFSTLTLDTKKFAQKQTENITGNYDRIIYWPVMRAARI